MTEDKQGLHVCPQCGLPFKTEDGLSIHITNWHSTGANGNQTNQARQDPAELLWRDLVQQIFHTPEGFQGLSEPEKRYFVIRVLVAEVYNGGFDQYFFNHSGEYYKITVLALQEIDAAQSLNLLQNAKRAIFGDESVPEDTGSRREFMLQSESKECSKLLDELDRQFWQDPDDLVSKVATYAKLHGLL